MNKRLAKFKNISFYSMLPLAIGAWFVENYTKSLWSVFCYIPSFTMMVWYLILTRKNNFKK